MTPNEFFDKYQDLVWSILNKAGKAKDEDACQEAFLALVEAAQRFDPERGTQFSTYAQSCIQFALKKHYHADKIIPDWQGSDGKYQSAGFIDSLDRSVNSTDEDSNRTLGDTIIIGEFELAAINRLDLERALNSLTKIERIVWDRKVDGKSCRQIGEEIGKSTATVERVLRDACLKIRRKYGNQ